MGYSNIHLSNTANNTEATYISDASLSTEVYWEAGSLKVGVSFGYIDGSLVTIDTGNTQLDASVIRVDAEINQLDTSVIRVDAEIAQIDASIVRIDAFAISLVPGSDASLSYTAADTSVWVWDVSLVSAIGY